MPTTNVVSLRPSFNLADPSSLVFDLSNAKPKDVLALVETFADYARTVTEFGPLPVTTGWNDITPKIAVDLLSRNRPGANRKVDPATVVYYAEQMSRGEWKATGQPILVDSEDHLADAQHRLYAGVISGVTFRSYVVTGIEAIENLFAYIDNARPRTAATALQTAGLNGVSSTIVTVIKLGEAVRLGVFNPTGLTKLPRFSPADMLGLANHYPNARKAARSAALDWADAADYLGRRKDLVAYLGMRIIDQYDEETADDFFEAIMDEARSASDPIHAFRKEIDKDQRADKPMRRHHVLAAMIKTFNAWRKGESLPRRWMLQVNEDFPQLDSGVEQTEAAE